MRRDLIILTLVLIVAFALRAWLPGRMSVEHFDEGVYASNFYSGHLNFRYPDRHLYAPPLLPAIYEWTLIVTGSAQAVMWVNVVLGTALVAAVWWLTRLIFAPSSLGDMAALAAATLVAFDNYLVQYSRAALTDIPVCLFIVLAVGLGLKALREKALWIIPAALFTGLAWWTKYNGWLPLAILGAGLGGWLVLDRAPKSLAISGIARWVLIGVAAFLFWAPCLWGLQDYGGYAAVAKNHAGYVVGWSGWLSGLTRQLAIQLHYSKSGFLSMAAAVVFLQSLFWPLSKVDRGAWWLAPVLVVGTYFLGDLPLLFGLSVLGFLLSRSLFKQHESNSAVLGWWVLLAWMLGLLLTTPLYSPYPRLLAPLKICLLIGSGFGIAASMQRLIGTPPISNNGQLSKPLLIKLVTMGVVLVVGQLALSERNPSYQHRESLKRIAAELVSTMRKDEKLHPSQAELDAIVYTIAEPGLYYHLASLENGPFEFITQPASNLGMLQPGKSDPRVTTYLVFTRDPDVETELSPEFNQLELVKSFEYTPSDLVLLDETAPSDLDRNRELVVQLWRVQRTLN